MGRTRIMVACAIAIVVFLIVAVRVLSISVFGTAIPAESRAAIPVNAAEKYRADIVDRNGTILATTLEVESLYANPRQIGKPENVARKLRMVLPDLSYSEIVDRLASDRAFFWIKRHLTPRQVREVNALGVPGLHFREEKKRFYPHGSMISHVLGFTDIDNNGMAGIEQAFDTRLKTSPRPLKLSLDLRVQHILTDELSKAMGRFGGIGAAGVVMDVRTGEIVALSSLPSFNPQDPGKASDDELFNRATLGMYEMGSVFKIFTIAGALDSGAVRLFDKFDVSEPIRVGGFTIQDFKPKDGRLTVPEVFMYSSNIGTVKIAMKAGEAIQYGMLKDLGLLDRSEIEIPEVGRPIEPSPWREINAMTVSYGHGLAVSPLQVSTAVSAIVNGGEFHSATLLHSKDGSESSGHPIFSRDTSPIMRKLMRLVVKHGTGSFASAPGYRVGGKTGTADKLKNGRYSDDSRIASFAGAFPMDDPRYVIMAMIDEPKGIKETYGYATGGWVAAPVVANVTKRMAPIVGVRPNMHLSVPGKKTHPLLRYSEVGFED